MPLVLTPNRNVLPFPGYPFSLSAPGSLKFLQSPSRDPQSLHRFMSSALTRAGKDLTGNPYVIPTCRHVRVLYTSLSRLHRITLSRETFSFISRLEPSFYTLTTHTYTHTFQPAHYPAGRAGTLGFAHVCRVRARSSAARNHSGPGI